MIDLATHVIDLATDSETAIVPSPSVIWILALSDDGVLFSAAHGHGDRIVDSETWFAGTTARLSTWDPTGGPFDGSSIDGCVWAGYSTLNYLKSLDTGNNQLWF